MADEGLHVLVVDDEPAIRRFLTTSLHAHGYTVTDAPDGRTALSLIQSRPPQLIILDLGLPDLDGIEITRLVREWSQIPIIILSVRGQEQDKIAALDAGANDYITKPFGVGELLARMRSAMRHSPSSTAEPIFTNDDLVVDLSKRVVTVKGQEVQLTPTEYDLLRAMIAHADKVLTHHQLLREVWGMGYDEELHMLRVNISNLLRKIESDPAPPRHIVTEPGVGYRLRIQKQ